MALDGDSRCLCVPDDYDSEDEESLKMENEEERDKI